MQAVKLSINGCIYDTMIEKNWTLLYVLRERLDLTGTKCGCGTNDCGACRVIVDGVAKNSCCLLARNMEGHTITTIEGVKAADGGLHPIQKAFVEAGAVQCGFCTPGMIMSAKALLDKNPNPTEDDARSAIEPNLCRCTGYQKIVEAILLAAEWMKEGK